MSKLIKAKQPCPDCGSSKALAVYVDGTFCFKCKTSHTVKVRISNDNDELEPVEGGYELKSNK